MEARRIVRPCLLAAALLLVPVAAHANAGTPLMWAEMFHLVFLNAVIGAIEAGLLRCFFGARGLRALGLMVAANYVSAGAGCAVLPVERDVLMAVLPGGAPLYKGPVVLAALVAGSFGLSALLEWPFVERALRPAARGRRRALMASLVAQAASYALILAPLYWAASPVTLYREANVVRNVRFATTPTATVYYLAPGGGSLWRVQTDGTGRMLLLAGLPIDKNLRLRLEPDRDTGILELDAVRPGKVIDRPWARPLVADVGRATAAMRRGLADVHRSDGNRFAFGRGTDLRPAGNRALEVFAGFWAGEGLEVWEHDVHHMRLVLEAPFMGWTWRHATLLYGDQVVAQLGWGDESQVVLLDLRTRRLGVIALGQSPVVVPADAAPAGPQPGRRAVTGSR